MGCCRENRVGDYCTRCGCLLVRNSDDLDKQILNLKPYWGLGIRATLNPIPEALTGTRRAEPNVAEVYYWTLETYGPGTDAGISGVRLRAWG